MTTVWYCPNCGYEVTARGRCHACRQRLVASAMPQLESGRDEDEVGYRLEAWGDRDRGRLIEQLNELEIHHRFEDDELVVAAEDEERVDDLVATVVLPEDGGSRDTDLVAANGAGPGVGGRAFVDAAAEDSSAQADVQLLADAARRLYRDPTDMHADADVAEASTAVFVSEHFGPIDSDTWAAVGRVTRRLLSVLGADEALDDQIRSEAGTLAKLLEPVAPALPRLAVVPAETDRHPETDGYTESTAEPQSAEEGEDAGRDDDEDDEDDDGDEDDEMDQTVYELAEWLPEQRAYLSVLLDEAGILHEWDSDELIVPAESEQEVEDLFAQVGGVDDDEDDDEVRYQAVAELFAACGRLAGDPTDEQRAQTVLSWARATEGPPLLGMDEIDWFRIMTRLRSLVEAIEGDEDTETIREGASTLHDMLRSVV